jgi:hypothetical protein
LVYVTVALPDTTPTINLTEDKLEVTATSDGKNYHVSLEFNKPIVPEVRFCALLTSPIATLDHFI